MNEAVDWSEVWRITGIGLTAVIVILSGLAIILWLADAVIRKLEKILGQWVKKE